ncbi:unnamed protein product [Parascedosporium putredinis]|uniref:Uncharacterized protein n=1 Tax=Parascedosporium putredinis TaxID=1442378 RepID=A0A9P1HDX1_9PEZI|nr:unnamed protein product [Parascedosporium putredinis]CAI8004726.1 unnamed protein product [Parascedosporium putredinis]
MLSPRFTPKFINSRIPRRSRRVSSTVKKSNYFEDDDSDDPLANKSSKKSKGTSGPRGKRKTEELDEVSDEYKEDSAAGQDEDDADEEEPEEDQDQNEFATKVTVPHFSAACKSTDANIALKAFAARNKENAMKARPKVSLLNSIVRPDPNVDGEFDSGDDEEE